MAESISIPRILTPESWPRFAAQLEERLNQPKGPFFVWNRGCVTVPTNTTISGAEQIVFPSDFTGNGTLVVTVFDAEGGVNVALNGTELGSLSGAAGQELRYEVAVTNLVEGDNPLNVFKIWSTTSDSAELRKLEVYRNFTAEQISDSAIWGNITGSGKPADNATVGATVGTDLSNAEVLGDRNILPSKHVGPITTSTSPVFATADSSLILMTEANVIIGDVVSASIDLDPTGGDPWRLEMRSRNASNTVVEPTVTSAYSASTQRHVAENLTIPATAVKLELIARRQSGSGAVDFDNEKINRGPLAMAFSEPYAAGATANTGALADLDTADFATEVSGAEKPADNATQNTGALADLDTVGTGEIDALAVTNPKLAALAVTAAKIAAGTITGDKIANLAITLGLMATDSVDDTKLIDLAVTGQKIANNAVDTTQLAALAVTVNELAANAVTEAKILDGSVVSGKLAALSVIAGKIASAAIDATSLFASNLTPVEIGAALPGSAGQGDVFFLTTDNQLYRYTGSAWTKAITAADMTGEITTTQITDSAVTTAKINALAVTATKIAANTITASEIAANTITAGQIASGTITTTEIAAATIVAGDIAAGAIGTTELAALSVTAAKIAAGTITASEIAADTIVAGNIAVGAIGASELAAASVIAGKLAANAIVAADGVIANLAVGTAQIALLAVTDAQIGTLNASKIIAGTIIASKFLLDNGVDLKAIVPGSLSFGPDETDATVLTITNVEAPAEKFFDWTTVFVKDGHRIIINTAEMVIGRADIGATIAPNGGIRLYRRVDGGAPTELVFLNQPNITTTGTNRVIATDLVDNPGNGDIEYRISFNKTFSGGHDDLKAWDAHIDVSVLFSK